MSTKSTELYEIAIASLTKPAVTIIRTKGESAHDTLNHLADPLRHSYLYKAILPEEGKPASFESYYPLYDINLDGLSGHVNYLPKTGRLSIWTRLGFPEHDEGNTEWASSVIKILYTKNVPGVSQIYTFPKKEAEVISFSPYLTLTDTSVLKHIHNASDSKSPLHNILFTPPDKDGCFHMKSSVESMIDRLTVEKPEQYKLYGYYEFESFLGGYPDRFGYPKILERILKKLKVEKIAPLICHYDFPNDNPIRRDPNRVTQIFTDPTKAAAGDFSSTYYITEIRT